eukprot:g2179.t1
MENEQSKKTQENNYPINPNPLVVLTYNIWFEGGFHKPATEAQINENAVARGKKMLPLDRHNAARAFKVRMDAVFDILVSSNADVINLQEVTPWSEEMIKKHPQLIEIYSISSNAIGRYGVLQLALKTRHPTFKTISMPTNMGRDLLAVQVFVGDNKPVLVCGAHFESLSSAPVRKEQLQVASQTMKDFSNSILCGDFNFCSYRNYDQSNLTLENDVLMEVLPNYDDVWSTIVWPKKNNKNGNETNMEECPTTPTWRDKGFTFDSERNVNIRQYERMRYDRILSNVVDLSPSSIHMVGDDIIVKDGERTLHPSDHFGLICTFDLVESNNGGCGDSELENEM